MPCHDCRRPYGDEHGFPDLLIPDAAWAAISPTGDDGGLLCPSCICKRLAAAGIKDCPGAFMSGPIRSVSQGEMESLIQRERAAAQADPTTGQGQGMAATLLKCFPCDGSGMVAVCLNPSFPTRLSTSVRCMTCGGSGFVRVFEQKAALAEEIVSRTGTVEFDGQWAESLARDLAEFTD